MNCYVSVCDDDDDDDDDDDVYVMDVSAICVLVCMYVVIAVGL